MNNVVSMIQSIKGQKWILLVFFVLFFAIMFIAYSHIQFKNALTKIFHNEQRYDVTLLQNLIKNHLDEASQNLGHAAAMITVSKGDIKESGKTLDMILTSHADDFFSISVIDSNGKVLASAGLNSELTNLFDYIEIEQDIDEIGTKIFLSERVISVTGQPATFLFFPFSIVPEQPEHFFVVGELNLKIFVDKQLSTIEAENNSFVVADDKGDIFTIVTMEHQDFLDMEKGNLFSLSQECYICHEKNSFDTLKVAVDNEQTIHELFRTPQGKLMNRTASTLKVFNEKWIVSISQPYEAIQGQITQNFYNNVVAASVLIACMFFVIFFTYRQRHKRALEIQYRILIDNINVGIFRSSEDGQILQMNEAMCSLLGLQKITAFKNVTIESLLSDKTDWQNIKASLLDKDVSSEGNYWVKRKKQGDFLALFLLHAVRDKFGKILFIEGVLQDITDMKRAEEERTRISRLESIELLAGGIAHDFNNQLTAIVGNIALSRLADEPRKRNELLLNAEKASYRAQGLTQQLLTFSRGGSPVKAPDAIEPLVRESVDFVLHGSNCNINYTFSPNLKLADIDNEQIRQVVQNLVINANQAMPEGGLISISAVNETVRNINPLIPGEYIKIIVQDNGSGIPSHILDRIFDPYFTTKETGSGLGLAVSYSIIKKHGGLILVNSTPGAGTTFTVYLPTAWNTEKGKQDEDSAKIIRGTGNILVIDDDPTVGETLVSFLDELGYEPYYVTNGNEAIHLLKENKLSFDSVVTDLTLPGGMGGVEIKDHIKKIFPDMKIIVASGYSNDPVLARYKVYGFDGVIRKPFKLVTVSEVLHRVLQK